MPSKIEISYKTIVFIVGFLISLWVLYQIREIIFLLFVAFVLMSALKPWTDCLERFHMPKILAVLVVYILFISILVFAGSSIVPPLLVQSVHLGEILPGYIADLMPFIKLDTQLLIQQIAPFGQNILKVTFGVFNNLLSLLTIFVVSFYLILERKNMEPHLLSFMGKEGAEKILTIFTKVEQRLGAWVRAQLTLMLAIGLLTSCGLILLGLPYVLPLAIIAGILEIIPTIGPVVSSIPAILVGFTISPLFALGVAVLYFIIQQTENQFIVPIVMKKAVGLPPLITLVSLMIGAKLGGIIGVILAVPVVVTLETILSEYLKLRDIH